MNFMGFSEQRLLFVLFAIPFNVNHTTLHKYCKVNALQSTEYISHLHYVTRNV
jgi:hypothetical protein